MSWLFSQALVEAFSEENSWDGEPFAQLSVMPTQHQFWRQDKTTEPLSLFRFGLTLNLLTESRGEELLTWFRAGFPARTLPQPAPEKGSMVPARDFGEKWPASWVRFDREKSLWKTAQFSLAGDLEEFSGTWPKWGSMRSGECWPRETSGHGIYGSASGCWLPTVGKNEFKGAGKARFIGSPEYRGAKMSEGLRTCETDPIYLSPSFGESAMGWPSTWTELAPLEMDKFQQWRQQHGAF